MDATLLLLGLVGLLAAGGVLESWTHRRRLRQIPIRIHVNGTRGKSSVTRLIAAGLRAGGIRTCAKTTGTLPRMILPDGREYPVFRPAKPNVIEQLRIVDAASEFGAEALVIECMALIPTLQWLSESRLVRATHGVITNAREDHLDVMGPTEHDVACALAATVPVQGTLYTSEQRRLDVFANAARDRSTNLVAVGQSDVDAITPDDLAGFSYMEHEDNVALALQVCADLGVDRETALQGMWDATPDPGAMTAHEIEFFGRKLYFVNGFAANDPESTEQIWNLAIARFPDVERRIAIFNCRADRPDRSRQLAIACAAWQPADHYILIGSGAYIFARAAEKAGMNLLKFTFAEDRRVEEIFETVVELAGASALVMGMANIGGPGLDVVRYFANRGRPKHHAETARQRAPVEAFT
ncbi:MAG: poly-gamma-glutamate synthase PgsB [Planctomycetia bacterium]|nr:poly-gamma-glutamate synthase PgsB [Planctomycetia bacterium]